jgi:CDP-glycerol glycerophosphotransferase
MYAAKELKHLIPVFHVPNKNLFCHIRKIGIRPTRGIPAFWYMLRAELIFIDNKNSYNPNASFLTGRFKIVQCWHGTPMKILRTPPKGNWLRKLKVQCALSACSHSTKIFKELFQTEKIFEIGYPRNDILFNPGFFSCERIDEKLDLKNFEKVFLYAPTHRRRNKPFNESFNKTHQTVLGRKIEKAVNPFDLNFLSELNEWLKNNNFIFLIKQHPYAKSVEGLEKFPYIRDVSTDNQDIQELAVHADVLISDYSSIILDFTLTNKPIILYAYDHDEYSRRPGLYFDYYQKLPGPFANTQQEFFDLIKNIEAWSVKADYLQKYKYFKDEFNRCQDGSTCRKLFELLL